MPIIEYRCSLCGEQFDVFIRVTTSTEQILCPRCGQGQVERQFSTFASPGAQQRRSAATCAPGGG